MASSVELVVFHKVYQQWYKVTVNDPMSPTITVATLAALAEAAKVPICLVDKLRRELISYRQCPAAYVPLSDTSVTPNVSISKDDVEFLQNCLYFLQDFPINISYTEYEIDDELAALYNVMFDEPWNNFLKLHGFNNYLSDMGNPYDRLYTYLSALDIDKLNVNDKSRKALTSLKKLAKRLKPFSSSEIFVKEMTEVWNKFIELPVA